MTVELNGTIAEVLNQDPLVIKNQKNWYHAHSYGGWGRFFLGLQQGKLLATRCTNLDCKEKRMWLPPRCECPDCWHAMEWVEAPTKGRIYSFTTVLYPGELFRASKPCPLISVELEGVCTKLMSYLKEGEPSIGLPIRAVFNTQKPTNTILDLAWVPA
jgi:uncharacterized OB-fold protein